MYFQHNLGQSEDTITAIVTPPGEGGVAIIRLSGAQALSIASQIFSKDLDSLESHKLIFGKFFDKNHQVIDEGLLVVMRNPRSYTGEDVVEIHCHGGVVIPKQILYRLQQLGARPAGPGEFTQRAFLNGKMDLSQAEAVQKLIAAKSEKAALNAQRELSGHLSRKIEIYQNKLLHVAALMEASIDFPDEDIEDMERNTFIKQILPIKDEIENLIASYVEGRRRCEGISICLVGVPNVGKSSLMNALIEQDRAIVTPIAGTTRDIVEADLFLYGYHVKLLDTAGIRDTYETIEEEGIKRSHKAIQEADLVLCILDSSRDPLEEEIYLIESLKNTPVIYVLNKTDINSFHKNILPEGIRVSAKLSQGLETLKEAIYQKIIAEDVLSKEEVVLTGHRHKNALEETLDHLSAVCAGLNSTVPMECLTIDLKEAIASLGRILGVNISDRILTEIFSTFCIGK